MPYSMPEACCHAAHTLTLPTCSRLDPLAIVVAGGSDCCREEAAAIEGAGVETCVAGD